MKQKVRLVSALVATAFAGSALAAVSADEAKQLGTTLTPWGAIKAGNKEGTIPEYTGKGVQPPANFDPKDPGQRPNPYNDKPLFSITAQNAAQYADKLEGMAEMFRKYPNYRMDVYPSHRDVVYPKYVVENTLKNATSCKGVEDELKLEGCYGGFPFPIPKTGRQAMWNHLMSYEGQVWQGKSNSYVTPPNGVAGHQALAVAWQEAPIFDQKAGVLPSKTVYWRIMQNVTAPARKVGEKILIHDLLDTTRRVWQYIPGQRRVKLAPDLAYDTPSPQSGGSFTMDDNKSYMGAMDRFDFKLVGKKEKLIMYNNYDLTYHGGCDETKLVNQKNFALPDCVRWELHRVTKVEATLKPGYRHAYGKRVFFWDEDIPGGGGVENYDASGKIFRIGNQSTYVFYENGGFNGANYDGSIFNDLSTGYWAFQGVTAMKGFGWSSEKPKPDIYFSPEQMAGEGIR